MLKLSTCSKYGIRALIELALNSKDEPVSISLISSKQKIPKNYLEQILHKLNRAGIVKSVRGASGGYKIKKPVEDISLNEVLKALEKQNSPIFCLGEEKGSAECLKNDKCFSFFICSQIEKEFSRALNSISLGKVVKEWKRNKNDEKKSLS